MLFHRSSMDEVWSTGWGEPHGRGNLVCSHDHFHPPPNGYYCHRLPHRAGGNGIFKNSAMNATPFQGSDVVITGGLGFVGSNLARRLVELGACVTLLDSLIPEYGGNLFNIAGIEDRVRVNISDVRDSHSMRYLVQDKNYL